MMSEYALISGNDIISDSDSEDFLIEHLEKDFDTKKYKKFFGRNGRAMIVKVVWIDDR
jgi:hypothetical protein